MSDPGVYQVIVSYLLPLLRQEVARLKTDDYSRPPTLAGTVFENQRVRIQDSIKSAEFVTVGMAT